MCDNEDEVELKDLVYGKLENTAFFRNIRAQLRAHIYHLIDSDDDNKETNPNSLTNQTLVTDNGKLALCLVDDLLENLELRYTGTVFRSESGFKADRTSIEMRNTLGLDMDFRRPVLLQLLEKLNPAGSGIDSIVSVVNNTEASKDSIEINKGAVDSSKSINESNENSSSQNSP